MSIARLPADVLAWLSNSMLADCDANALACAGKVMLQSMRRYRWKGWAPLPDADASFGMLQRVRVPTDQLLVLLQRLPQSVSEVHFAEGRSYSSLPVDNPPFPAALRTVHLGYHYNQPVTTWQLPAGLTHLRMSKYYNQPIEGLKLPAALIKFQFGYCFNHSLQSLQLPSGLLELTLGSYWRRPLSELPPLPDSLLSLCVGEFNLPADAQFRWPPNLRSFHFSYLEHPLPGNAQLPPWLQELHIGFGFAQPLELLPLPEALLTLDFHLDHPFNFRHHINAVVWPAGLRSLTLPERWNQPVAGLRLPDSLTSLSFGSYFCQSLREWHPPASLLDFKLTAHWRGFAAADLVLPALLTHFDIPGAWSVELADLALPAGLQSIKLGRHTRITDTVRVHLPAALTSIDLGEGFEGTLDGLQWPPALTHLRTGNAFNQPLLQWIPPPTLTHLQLGSNNADYWRKDRGGWNLPASQLRLPPNLQRLEFGFTFDQPLVDWHPPPSLRHLHFARWNRPWSDLQLPAQLDSLRFDKWNQMLEGLRLPSRLRELHYFGETARPLRSMLLPSSLHVLTVPKLKLSDLPAADLPQSVPASLRLIVVESVAALRAWLSWLKRAEGGRDVMHKVAITIASR